MFWAARQGLLPFLFLEHSFVQELRADPWWVHAKVLSYKKLSRLLVDRIRCSDLAWVAWSFQLIPDITHRPVNNKGPICCFWLYHCIFNQGWLAYRIVKGLLPHAKVFGFWLFFLKWNSAKICQIDEHLSIISSSFIIFNNYKCTSSELPFIRAQES